MIIIAQAWCHGPSSLHTTLAVLPVVLALAVPCALLRVTLSRNTLSMADDEPTDKSAALQERLASLEGSLAELKALRDEQVAAQPQQADYEPDPRRRAIAEWQAMEAAMEARLEEAGRQRDKVASTMGELEAKMAESDERLAAAQREMSDLEGAVKSWAGNIFDDDDDDGGEDDGEEVDDDEEGGGGGGGGGSGGRLGWLPNGEFGRLPVSSSEMIPDEVDLSDPHVDLSAGQSSLLLQLPPALLLNRIGDLLDGVDFGALGGACTALRSLVARGFKTRALRLLAADKFGWLGPGLRVSAGFLSGVFPMDAGVVRSGCFRMLCNVLGEAWDRPAPSVDLAADAEAMRKAIWGARKRSNPESSGVATGAMGGNLRSNADLLEDHYGTLALPAELLAGHYDQAPPPDRWSPSASLLAVERVGRWAALGGAAALVERYDLPAELQPTAAEVFAVERLNPAGCAGLVRTAAAFEVRVEYAMIGYGGNVTAVARATEQAADFYGQLYEHCVDAPADVLQRHAGLGWLCRRLAKQSELYRWLGESGCLADINAAEVQAEGPQPELPEDDEPVIGLGHPATRQARVMRARTLADIAEALVAAASPLTDSAVRGSKRTRRRTRSAASTLTPPGLSAVSWTRLRQPSRTGVRRCPRPGPGGCSSCHARRRTGGTPCRRSAADGGSRVVVGPQRICRGRGLPAAAITLRPRSGGRWCAPAVPCAVPSSLMRLVGFVFVHRPSARQRY